MARVRIPVGRELSFHRLLASRAFRDPLQSKNSVTHQPSKLSCNRSRCAARRQTSFQVFVGNWRQVREQPADLLQTDACRDVPAVLTFESPVDITIGCQPDKAGCLRSIPDPVPTVT